MLLINAITQYIDDVKTSIVNKLTIVLIFLIA